MDSGEGSKVTRGRSKSGRRLGKALYFRSTSRDGKKSEKEEPRKRLLEKEAFLAAIFASVSTIKATYAQLQMAEYTSDAKGIHCADGSLVAELKSLSELKHSFQKKLLNQTSVEAAIVSNHIQELKGVNLTYEVTCKKLDSQVKLRDSKLTSLKEKLAEVQMESMFLKRRLGHVSVSYLSSSQFDVYRKRAKKSIQSFVGMLIQGMQAANWDIDAAVESIVPGVSFLKPSDKCYPFESFVCKEMFDGFNSPDILKDEISPNQENKGFQSFDEFLELKSMKPSEHLAGKPKSNFATFCQRKYLRLVHPKMESSLFDNLEQWHLVNSGDFPGTPFFTAFSEMAKHVWLLHCLALSFHPQATIFHIQKGSRFSQVWMESLNHEALFSGSSTAETDPVVAFSAFPGFRVGGTVLQCQVYLQ